MAAVERTRQKAKPSLCLFLPLLAQPAPQPLAASGVETEGAGEQGASLALHAASDSSRLPTNHCGGCASWAGPQACSHVSPLCLFPCMCMRCMALPPLA
jgi:hypothetical protein